MRYLPLTPEDRTEMLARIGGKYVPRLSMLVRYNTVRHSAAPLSLQSSAPRESRGNDHSDGGSNQNAHLDTLSGDNVENMTQQGRG